MKRFQIHFIWCGSNLDTIIKKLLIPKIIELKYFFADSNYKITYNLWTDRNTPVTIPINVRHKLRVDFQIRNIFDLFNQIEQRNDINYHSNNPRFLRYLFSDESGVISTYSKCEIFNSSSKNITDSFKPMPAIAADIVKALLCLLEPGLYIDIGLDISDELQTNPIDLDNILDEYNNFKSDVFFAATEGIYLKELSLKSFDYQIIYSKKDPRTTQIFKAIIESYYMLGNLHQYPTNSISHNSTMFRSYNLHHSEMMQCGSYTPTIWHNIFKDNNLRRLIFEEQGQSINKSWRLKKTCNIPIEYKRGSIASFVYKNRNKSPIDDYKTTHINESRTRSKYQNKFKKSFSTDDYYKF